MSRDFTRDDQRRAALDWAARYETAWRTAGTDGLGDLFAYEALYRTAPYETPYRGLPAIAKMWEAGRDGPDEAFTFEAAVVAVDWPTAVLETEVTYTDPPEGSFRNLWIIAFDNDGRARTFEEWPFAPGLDGWFEPGPDRVALPRHDRAELGLDGTGPSRRSHRAAFERARERLGQTGEADG
ncbi:MAG TPA: nuclear transport factor 2 family protein [Microthrixaceae bacterium]|nr:nuclear transport factor 2 family protein [Microthrixaceae bacterium]